MNTDFQVGQHVEITRVARDSCGEVVGDRGLVIKVGDYDVLIYHLTMERDNGWSIGSYSSHYTEELKNMGIITDEEADRRRFWWYRKDEVARVSQQPKIEWID